MLTFFFFCHLFRRLSFLEKFFSVYSAHKPIVTLTASMLIAFAPSSARRIEAAIAAKYGMILSIAPPSFA